MNRRHAIGSLGSLGWGLQTLSGTPAWAQSAHGVTKDEIVFGQTADLSASRAPITRLYSEGARIYFDEINRKGGVADRKIRVIQLDDGYQTQRAKDNAVKLVQEQRVFGLVHAVGTGIAEQLIRYADERGVPLVHPLTGADNIRAPQMPSKNTFFLRASYRKELEKMISQLHTVGISNIALVYEDEPFGQGIRAITEAAMKERSLQLSALGIIPFNKPTEVSDAVTALAKVQPRATIIGSAGPSVENFVKAYSQTHSHTQYYCLSVSSAERLSASLGKLSQGIIVSQVMPSVQNSVMPVVREYRDAVAREKLQPTAFGLEGYISARIIVDALRLAGKNLTREAFVDALATPEASQVGGFPIGSRAAVRSGSPFVDLAMITGDGRLRL